MAVALVFGFAMAPAGVTGSLFTMVFDADVRHSALSQVLGSAFARRSRPLYAATKTNNSIVAYLIAVSVI